MKKRMIHYKAGEYLIYTWPSPFGNKDLTEMVRVMESTITFSGAKKRVPVQWLDGGPFKNAWYLCPESLLRRPTRKEKLAWQLDQL